MRELLKMTDISKEFPGVKALDKVSFSLKGGSVHALMGENGAGKSTLMKCLFGVYSADSGTIEIDGVPVSFKSPKEALDYGVAMVHQELNQALKLSVTDNMWLGRFKKVKPYLPFIDVKEALERTKRIFDELNISIDPTVKCGELSVSERQMVEIAKAVSYNAKIIVFDEPTSSLTEPEAEHLFEIINKLRTRGCGIIYISHKMAEILRISDEVTVMRDGRHIATTLAKELSTDKIISLMVGRKLENRYPERISAPGEVLLDVEEISGEYSRLKPSSFSLKRGEILGIAGLDGSGRTELLEAIFGIATLKSGRLFLEGKEIKNRNPKEAIKNGFALLTEERRATGIFGILNIRENTTITSMKKYLSLFLINEKKRNAATADCISKMRVKAPDQFTKIRTLSGGNQQKVILGRWLLTSPKVLMLDEPTRGIDVGAKYEIYNLLGELAKEGKGVIVVSSEMEELLGICDRLLVMSGGRIAGELDAKSATQERIMELAAKYV